MSEVNGTNALLYRLSGVDTFELVGQIELTSGFNGTPIEITNKASNDFTTYLDGELATKGNTVGATLVYSSDAEFRRMRDSVKNGVIEQYRIDYTGLSADYADFRAMPNGMSDSLPLGDKVTTTVTFSTDGTPL